MLNERLDKLSNKLFIAYALGNKEKTAQIIKELKETLDHEDYLTVIYQATQRLHEYLKNGGV